MSCSLPCSTLFLNHVVRQLRSTSFLLGSDVPRLVRYSPSPSLLWHTVPAASLLRRVFLCTFIRSKLACCCLQ